ncbi:MAG: hypothetical protein RL563_2004, partial [Pseudomonadota bacterium]
MSLSFKLIDTELEAFLKPRDSDHKILWLSIYRQQIGFDIYVGNFQSSCRLDG